MKSCAHCEKSFEILSEDKVFYKQVNVPEPTFCPDCRFQRRLSHRNERNLYKRNCSFSHLPIISIFAPSSPFLVLSQKVWWSDAWDPFQYGKDVDFTRPFFDQIKELRDRVPRLCLLSKNSENAEYTNHAANNKNCYLTTIVFNSEDVYYSRKIFDSKTVFDSEYIFSKGELLYECFWGENLYNCQYCTYCSNSNNLKFCIDCKGCSDCYMSSNLRNKQYVAYNEQLSKEDYESKMKEFAGRSFEHLLRDFDLPKAASIYPALHNEHCENVEGDLVSYGKNLHQCFYSYKGENCRYCMEFDRSADDKGSLNCMDCFGFGASELIYEVQAQADGYNNQFCSWSYDLSNSQYCDMCFNSSQLFGCVGLHSHNQYCILNKQYTEEEYKTLVPRVIEHMKSTGEWGEFFPSSISPFGYNESMAMEYFPLTKEEALAQGFRWKDSSASDSENSHADALRCEVCTKSFRLIPQELDFYATYQLPHPTACPDCRHQKRIQNRNWPKLWDRECTKCHKSVKSSTAPDRKEVIYCEECYLGALY